MYIAVSGFTVGWLLVFVYALFHFKKLLFELSLLPPLRRRPQRHDHSHPVVGKKLDTLLPTPELASMRETAVIFASATCSYCHHELEEFLERNQTQPVPVVCYVSVREPGQFERFIENYSGLIPFQPVAEDRLKEIGIHLFPTFCLLDEEGIVRHFSPIALGIRKSYAVMRSS